MRTAPSLRQIQLYYSGAFTIVPGAFSTGSLTPLLVLFIPEYDSVLGTLAAYDWTEDRRAAYFEDVYGITLLATGYCSNCKRTCSYTVEYEQWKNSEHCVRHWCSNCGYDQAGGVNGEAHSFRKRRLLQMRLLQRQRRRRRWRRKRLLPQLDPYLMERLRLV